MVTSRAAVLTKAVVLDTAVVFLYFPVWWYGPGAVQAARGCFGIVARAARSFGVHIWLKNLFRPMFAQRDIPGRIISFVFRLLTIIFYSVVLALLLVLAVTLFLAWLALPIFLVYEFIRQLAGIIAAAP